MEYVKKLLAKVAIDPARIEMYNLSAAMGPKWADICTTFTEKVRTMGPSPIWYAKHKDKKRSEEQ